MEVARRSSDLKQHLNHSFILLLASGAESNGDFSPVFTTERGLPERAPTSDRRPNSRAVVLSAARTERVRERCDRGELQRVRVCLEEPSIVFGLRTSAPACFRKPGRHVHRNLLAEAKGQEVAEWGGAR